MNFEKQNCVHKGVNTRTFSNKSSPDEGLFTADIPTGGGVGETHRGLKSRHIQFLALGTDFFPMTG